MQTASRIWNFFKIVTIALLVSVVFHSILSILFKLSYPWNTFLFEPSDRFNDWNNTLYVASTNDPYFSQGKAVSAYFPFTYWLIKQTAFGNCCNGLESYFVFSSIFMGTGLLSFWVIKLSPCLGENSYTFKYLFFLVIAISCSYPLIFSIDRGNLDIWIAGLSLIFVATYRHTLCAIGYFSLAIAIAMKGYPAAFLLLALADKKYYFTFGTIALSLMLTIFSMIHFDGGFSHNLAGWLAGLKKYNEIYVIGTGSIHFSSDPYNGSRLILMAISNFDSTKHSAILFLRLYDFISLLFAFYTVVFVLLAKTDYWRKVVAVCLLGVLFPNVANDYKLLILTPGLLILFQNQHVGKAVDSSIFYITMLMIPKSYLFFRGVSISGLINPILLLMLAKSVFHTKLYEKNEVISI